MKKTFVALSVLALGVVLFAGMAKANGTLTATFIYNGSGSNQPLGNAYVYLQNGSLPIIQGKYSRSAQYIFGPTNSSGHLSASVPNGTYYVRLRRSAPLSSTPGSSQVYGPPRAGDYTGNYGGPTTSAITVTTGSVIDLGTVYASIIGPSIFGAPVTISGTVTAGGHPVAGYFVYATKTQCSFGWQNNCQGGVSSWLDYYTPVISSSCQSSVFPSGCNGTKYLAQSATGSNGNYTIYLTNPGTYYVIAQPHPGSQSNACGGSGGCPSVYGDYGSRTYASSATPWDPAPSCAACICGGQYYANCSEHTGTALCYSACPVTVATGQNTVNISW